MNAVKNFLREWKTWNSPLQKMLQAFLLVMATVRVPNFVQDPSLETGFQILTWLAVVAVMAIANIATCKYAALLDSYPVWKSIRSGLDETGHVNVFKNDGMTVVETIRPGNSKDVIHDA